MKKKLIRVAEQAQDLAAEMQTYADMLSLLAAGADEATAARTLAALEEAGFVDGDGNVQVEPVATTLN